MHASSVQQARQLVAQVQPWCRRLLVAFAPPLTCFDCFLRLRRVAGHRGYGSDALPRLQRRGGGRWRQPLAAWLRSGRQLSRSRSSLRSRLQTGRSCRRSSSC